TPVGARAARLREPARETRYALGLAATARPLAAWPEATLAAAAHRRLREAEAAGLGERDLTAVAGHVAAGHGPVARVVPLNPATVPATNGMYSHAVRVGGMLYVSGQAAFDERGNLVGEGSMTEQAEHVFRCLRSEERRVGKECRWRWSTEQSSD